MTRLMSVVLPAPFGPMTAVSAACGQRQASRRRWPRSRRSASSTFEIGKQVHGALRSSRLGARAPAPRHCGVVSKDAHDAFRKAHHERDDDDAEPDEPVLGEAHDHVLDHEEQEWSRRSGPRTSGCRPAASRAPARPTCSSARSAASPCSRAAAAAPRRARRRGPAMVNATSRYLRTGTPANAARVSLSRIACSVSPSGERTSRYMTTIARSDSTRTT